MQTRFSELALDMHAMLRRIEASDGRGLHLELKSRSGAELYFCGVHTLTCTRTHTPFPPAAAPPLPHKYLLFRPAAAELRVVLAAAAKVWWRWKY